MVVLSSPVLDVQEVLARTWQAIRFSCRTRQIQTRPGSDLPPLWHTLQNITCIWFPLTNQSQLWWEGMDLTKTGFLDVFMGSRSLKVLNIYLCGLALITGDKSQQRSDCEKDAPGSTQSWTRRTGLRSPGTARAWTGSGLCWTEELQQEQKLKHETPFDILTVNKVDVICPGSH